MLAGGHSSVALLMFYDIDICYNVNAVARSSMLLYCSSNEASRSPRHSSDSSAATTNISVRFTILFCAKSSMHARWVDGDVSDHCDRI